MYVSKNDVALYVYDSVKLMSQKLPTKKVILRDTHLSWMEVFLSDVAARCHMSQNKNHAKNNNKSDNAREIHFLLVYTIFRLLFKTFTMVIRNYYI